MERQNITLSLPKELLAKVKHLAIDKNTSVSGLLVQTLEELVRKDESYSKAENRQLSLMKTGFPMGKFDPKSWVREELYDRK